MKHTVPLFQVQGDTDYTVPLFQVQGDTGYTVRLSQVLSDTDHAVPLFQVLGVQGRGSAAPLPAVPTRVAHVLPKACDRQLHAEVRDTGGGESGAGQAGHWHQTHNFVKFH